MSLSDWLSALLHQLKSRS